MVRIRIRISVRMVRIKRFKFGFEPGEGGVWDVSAINIKIITIMVIELPTEAFYRTGEEREVIVC